MTLTHDPSTSGGLGAAEQQTLPDGSKAYARAVALVAGFGVAAGTLTRLANTTAYASGQLVANSASAGAVQPIALQAARILGGTGCITGIRLSTNKAGLAGTEVFRVHLFRNSPVVAVGDGAAFTSGGALQVNGVGAIYLGPIDVTLASVFTDGAKGFAQPTSRQQIVFDTDPASMNLYALLEARGAYNPASQEILTVVAELARD